MGRCLVRGPQIDKLSIRTNKIASQSSSFEYILAGNSHILNFFPSHISRVNIQRCRKIALWWSKRSTTSLLIDWMNQFGWTLTLIDRHSSEMEFRFRNTELGRFTRHHQRPETGRAFCVPKNTQSNTFKEVCPWPESFHFQFPFPSSHDNNSSCRCFVVVPSPSYLLNTVRLLIN